MTRGDFIMRKKRTERKNVKERLNDVLDLPSDMLLDIPRMTMNDNRELQIENYRSVLEYEDGQIKRNSKNHIIKINGKKLEIVSITDDEIFIRGVITGISFLH